MSTGINIWQGTDKSIVMSHDFIDLPSATAIEVYIDTPNQIVKTLGDGVSAVTSTTFLLIVSAEDTSDVPSDEYAIQARITTVGGIIMGRIQPQFVKILNTVFTDST